MKRTNWNRDWFFTKGMANLMNYGRKVQLPHDYMIGGDVREDAPAGAAMGYFSAGVGTYTKFLTVPEEWEGERVYLHFDGVMMNASVSVNGSLVKRHHYGYTPFSVDITDALYLGESNRVTVSVNPSMQPNSRWYTGAGIYRAVELSHVKPLHIEPDGIFAYTKRIQFSGENSGSGEEDPEKARAEFASVMVEVTLRNHFAEDHQVRVRALISPENQEENSLENREENGISDREQSDAEAGSVVRDTVLLVKAGSTAVARIPVSVKQPVLWDAEHPGLYQVKIQLEDMGVFTVCLKKERALEGVCDEGETLFGIRTVTADAVCGLLINGRPVKLKGGCIHHDNGILGAVSLYDSEYRKLCLLKAGGFNAVRLAHNPGSRSLLEICDRIGLYVFDEAFDAWGHSKQPGDYSQFFAGDWKEDMAAFILRDRNHPAVIFWSTGNEVEERGGLGAGYSTAGRLAAYVRSLDPTRLVSNGLCSMWSGLDDKSFIDQMRQMQQKRAEGMQNADLGEEDTSWEERTEAFCSCLDVVGYNYLDSHYEHDGQRYPERVILGTESFPNQIDRVWELVERLPYVIGDFTWTAVDYIGEAGIGKSAFFAQYDPKLAMGEMALSSHMSSYPWRLANDADITISGAITPQGVYRRIVWGSAETGIFVQHPENYELTEVVSKWGWNQMTDCWNYEEYVGKPVKVYVYSAAPSVELWLNGRSMEIKAAGKDNRFTAVFQVNYEPGSLAAVSLGEDGEISRAQLVTTGAPAALRLKADRLCLRADGESLSYVEVEIVDAEGRTIKHRELELEAVLTGTEAEGAFMDEKEKEHCARLAGFGSDAPVTEDNYTAGKCKSYHGRALAVVRSGCIAGTALLRVTSPGLLQAEVEIRVE